MREIERDLARIQQVENEYNFLQLTLNEKTRKAQEMNSRLKLDEGSNSASTLAERERELLKIKDNYESTMVSLNE
jgi:cell shape-determining protein MreC